MYQAHFGTSEAIIRADPAFEKLTVSGRRKVKGLLTQSSRYGWYRWLLPTMIGAHLFSAVCVAAQNKRQQAFPSLQCS